MNLNSVRRLLLLLVAAMAGKRFVAVTKAFQGGYSAHVLPSPVELVPVAGLPHLRLAPDITPIEEGDGITSAIKNWTAPTIDWVRQESSTTEVIGLETGGPAGAPALTLKTASSPTGFENNNFELIASVSQFQVKELRAYTFECLALGAESFLTPNGDFSYESSLQISVDRQEPFFSYAYADVAHYDIRSGGQDIAGTQFSAYGYNEGIFVRSDSGTVPLSVTSWAHIAIVQTESQLKIFVGGQLFYEVASAYGNTLENAPETSTLIFRVQCLSFILDYFNNNRTGTRPRVSGIRFTPRALYDSNFTPPSNITDFA